MRAFIGASLGSTAPVALPTGRYKSLRYDAELRPAVPGGTRAFDNPALCTEDTTWSVEAPWAPRPRRCSTEQRSRRREILFPPPGPLRRHPASPG
ncbi:hypothetical protein [Streptomyces sp. NPDC088766]|uniref:hypothetical protein n=1 Tax=Streptomyces sp. NPDC088766 TaxID=3365893 RepID=UPI0037F3A462